MNAVFTSRGGVPRRRTASTTPGGPDHVLGGVHDEGGAERAADSGRNAVLVENLGSVLGTAFCP